jgi:hypothetical protein
MYLTSHHVLAPETRHEGVNSFLYLHGAEVWSSPPPDVPDENPGTLAAQSIEVRPPGNSVRSYLDIVAPDEVRWDEIWSAMMDFVGQSQRRTLPWEGISGRCFFRLGMERGLAQRWQRELAVLYRASQALRMANLAWPLRELHGLLSPPRAGG